MQALLLAALSQPLLPTTEAPPTRCADAASTASLAGLLDLVRLADHVDGLLRQRLRRDDSTWARFWGAVW